MDEMNIWDSLLLLDSALPRPAISSKSSEIFSFYNINNCCQNFRILFRDEQQVFDDMKSFNCYICTF
jgi:hypothetical protein